MSVFSSRTPPTEPIISMEMFKFKTPKFFVFVLLFMSLGLLMSGIGSYKFLSYSNYQFPDIGIFLEKFQGTYLKGLVGQTIELDRDKMKKKMTLTHGSYYLPKASLVEPYISSLRSIEGCKPFVEPQKRDRQSQKLKMWWNHICQNGPLPKKLWIEQPFTHPLGGSWAHWVWSQKSFAQNWLEENKPYLHILEYQFLNSENLTQQERFLSKMDADTLQSLNLGLVTVVDPPFIFLKNSHTHKKKIFTRLQFTEVQMRLSESPYVIAQKSEGRCLFDLGQYCWKKNPYYEKSYYNLWGYLAVGGLLVLIFSMAYLVWKIRREYDSQRNLMVHTLAHELRHPATSINMSLEFFRDKIDDFEEDCQVEVLRMIDEVKRLKLLVRASEQYLVTDSQSKINFKPIIIKSVNSYLNRIARSYDVRFHALDEDTSFECDAYWLGVCIENLLKNGIRHGKQPVDLKATFENNYLQISVVDSGEGIPDNYKKNLNPFAKSDKSEGIGLGLSITHRIVTLMGAKLTYSNNPSTFCLIIKRNGSECVNSTVA